ATVRPWVRTIGVASFLRTTIRALVLVAATSGAPAFAGPPKQASAAGEVETAVTAAERPLVVKEVSFSRETGVCHATLVNGLTLHPDRIEAEPAGRCRLVVAVAGGEIHERPDQAGLTQLAVAGWAQESARAAATG